MRQRTCKSSEYCGAVRLKLAGMATAESPPSVSSGATDSWTGTSTESGTPATTQAMLSL